MGDVLLTTPAIRALRRAQPEAQIDFLVKPQFTRILLGNPNITKIIPFTGDLAETISVIGNSGYTYIIDLHGNIRTLALKSGSGIKAHTFKKLNVEKWLMTAFKINRLPSVHICRRYLDAAAPLGAKPDAGGLDFYPDGNDEFVFQNFEISKSGYIVWAIGGNHHTKRMPSLRNLELASALKITTYIIGGKEDFSAGEEAAKMSPLIINLCGKLSIGESAMLIQHSKGVISHDTGMMHIAAALNKPIASIWGNTIPEFGMYPYFPADSEAANKSRIFEVKNLKCRPCSKIGYKKCPKQHFNCMMMQDIEGIAAWANKLCDDE